jgi:hypothetical protein
VVLETYITRRCSFVVSQRRVGVVVVVVVVVALAMEAVKC